MIISRSGDRLGPRGIPGMITLAVIIHLSLSFPAGAAGVDLADGDTGSGIRCTITAPADVNRTDIFMQLHTCSSLNDYPECTFTTREQRSAVRRAYSDRVEFYWDVLPGERFYYGTCELCLIDWSEEYAAEHPELQRCATSPPLLLGTTNGVPLVEPSILVGVLAATAFLCILRWAAKRLL